MFYYQDSPVEGEDATEFLWITDREINDSSEVTEADKSSFKLTYPTDKPELAALMDWMHQCGVKVEKA